MTYKGSSPNRKKMTIAKSIDSSQATWIAQIAQPEMNRQF